MLARKQYVLLTDVTNQFILQMLIVIFISPLSKIENNSIVLYCHCIFFYCSYSK